MSWINSTTLEGVRFKVRNLKHRHKLYVGGELFEGEGGNPKLKHSAPISAWMTARFGLTAIEGFTVDGMPLELEFEKTDIGGALEDVVTIDCMDNIESTDFLGEIAAALWERMELPKDKKDDVGFTQSSPSPSVSDVKESTVETTPDVAL